MINKPQDAFVYNRKTDEIDPINLIATNQVKCLNCGKYVFHTDIQAHLRTHENQQLNHKTVTAPVILPNENKWTAQPLDLSKLATKNALRNSFLSQSTFDIPTEPIDVQTMNAQELPLPQYRRKQISVPLHNNKKIPQSHPQPSIPQPILSQKIAAQPQNQFVSTNVPITTMRQNISVGDYFEPIQIMKPQSIQIHSNKVSMKKNINASTAVDKNDYIDQAKIPPRFQSETTPQTNRYTVTPYNLSSNSPDIDPKPSSDSISISDSQPNIITVPNNNKYLSVQSQSNYNNTHRKDKSNINNSIGIAPISQQVIGGINLSRATNKPSVSNQNTRSQSNFFSFLCGDPENTLNNQHDSTTNPRLIVSTYENQNHNHNDGANYACPSCGGFYCPTCKSTVPPEYRRPPPYTFNDDIHSSSRQHFHQEIRTNISYVTPSKHKEI